MAVRWTWLAITAVGCTAASSPPPATTPAPAPAVAGEAAPPVAPPTDSAEPDPPAPAATPIADDYREVAGRIIEAALADDTTWDRLAHLTDRIGHRLGGSAALDQAIAWAAGVLEVDGHENVHTQKVMVPHWVRGDESASIVAPIERELHILGLGGTVGTPRRGVTAPVVVVRSEEELAAIGDGARGKIVLFDNPMPAYDPDKGSGYGATVVFRTDGPAMAAKHGAVAVLVRSVTARSLRSPHTGATRYEKGTPPIPAAAVTTEDAALLARLAAAGPVEVRLTLGARTLPDAESANVVAELRGRERPEEIVLIGAHIDSWDVGQGAHDDGAGCVIVMQALRTLRALGLRPRRTIRVVLFTNEENGLRGAIAYARDNAGDVPRHVAAIETDSGAFAPIGFQVKANDAAVARATDIATLLEPIGAGSAKAGFAGADLIPLTDAGVPGLGLWVEGSTYFDYHHTHADTLDKVDPIHLRRNVAAMAVMAFVLADMPERFAHDPDEP